MSSNPVSNPTTSVETVLDTTELLEHILNFLPMPQVLGKSRVSRNWKAVIDNSPVLQKKLFFRHNDKQAEVVSMAHLFPKPPDVPRNLSVGQMVQFKVLMSLASKPVYTTPIELNPLVNWNWINQIDFHVSHEMKSHHPEPFHPSVAGFEIILGKYNRAFVSHCFGDSSQTPQAIPSWHNMCLTSPPITDVVFDIPNSVGGAYKYICVKVHAEHGVTLGLLYDRVRERLKQLRTRGIGDRRRSITWREGPNREYPTSPAWSWVSNDRVMFLVQHAKTLQILDRSELSGRWQIQKSFRKPQKVRKQIRLWKIEDGQTGLD